MYTTSQIDGLVQERRNSIANALELRLSCTNLSICHQICRNTVVVLTGQSIGTQSLVRQQSIFQTILVDWKVQAKHYDPICHAFQFNQVQFHYKMSNFPPNTCNKHPIAHP